MKIIEHTSNTEKIKKLWLKKCRAWIIIIVILGQLHTCNLSKNNIF